MSESEIPLTPSQQDFFRKRLAIVEDVQGQIRAVMSFLIHEAGDKSGQQWSMSPCGTKLVKVTAPI